MTGIFDSTEYEIGFPLRTFSDVKEDWQNGRPISWEDLFTAAWCYNHVYYVRNCNTRAVCPNGQIYSASPIYHAAVLFFYDKDLSGILLVRDNELLDKMCSTYGTSKLHDRETGKTLLEIWDNRVVTKHIDAGENPDLTCEEVTDRAVFPTPYWLNSEMRSDYYVTRLTQKILYGDEADGEFDYILEIPGYKFRIHYFCAAYLPDRNILIPIQYDKLAKERR